MTAAATLLTTWAVAMFAACVAAGAADDAREEGRRT